MGFDKKLYKLGQKIKTYRLRAGLSQFELESKIEAAAGSISRIENGQVNPTKETIEKISEALVLTPVEQAELYDVGVFRAENIVERLNWLAESETKKDLLQRACNMMFLLHRNYNGGAIVLFDKTKNALHSTHLSTQLNLKDVDRIIGFHYNNMAMLIDEHPENYFGKTLIERKPYESPDASDFAVGFMNRLVARSAAKMLGYKIGISYPLHCNEKSLGVIFYTKTKEDSFSEYEKLLLELITKNISILLYKFSSTD